MKQKFTKLFAMTALFALLFSGIQAIAIGPMKDIELDPDKKQNDGNMLAVFPNPASTEAKINFWFEVDSRVTVQVFDINGKEVSPSTTGDVIKARTNQCAVDVTDFEAGVYFVKVTNQNGTSMVSKLLVAH